ncbi:uncharacterized protein LOC132287772 [Cornus florida]|uniref:uncharacterized protein LOC132287772 n=1 Tax=Cornus florida TaxID=4283 RepID=UPI0028A2334A|nr:uncharacterized protein LOC132287772 [Cornus florida]
MSSSSSSSSRGSSSPTSPSSSRSGDGVNYISIQHQVSKMDTLAGVAIKYGVEVADIKRMNKLVTDLQMFALKSLKIPLPGKRPPPPCLSIGSASPRKSSNEKTSQHLGCSDKLESFQTRKLKSQQQKVSPAMGTLQNYYGLKSPTPKGAAEGTEMAVYRSGNSHCFDDRLIPKISPFCNPPLDHHKSSSLTNGFLPDNGAASEDVAVAQIGDEEGERSNEKSVRRRQKTETDSGTSTTEWLLKEENIDNGSSQATTGNNSAQRTTSGSRTAMVADGEPGWLNSIIVGLGDSIMADGLAGIRKSSSTLSVQDQDNKTSSIWPTFNWRFKPDLQVFSTASINKPIFDGLPKPIIGRRSKSALD